MCASRYKHVVWHVARSQWLVQIRKPCVYKMFPTESRAAEFVRKLLKQPTRVLRSSGPRSADFHGKYKYVNWQGGARNRWLARIDGKLFQYCKRKKDAVLAVSKCSGVPVSALRIGTRMRSGAGNYLVQDSRSKKRKLFEQLWQVYSRDSRGRRCTVVPGDLEASVVHHRRSAKMYDADPGLLVCSLRGKELAWKDAVVASWEASRPKTVEDTFEVLQSAVKTMGSRMARETSAVWQTHVNKNVYHHSGWLPMLQINLPMLQKMTGKARTGSGVLTLGTMGQQYKLLPFSKKFCVAFDRFRRTGVIIKDLRAPRSCQEWSCIVTKARQDAIKQGLRTVIQMDYSWQWLLRTQLFCIVRSAGVKRMACKDVTMKVLGSMAPDQQKHLKALSEHMVDAKDLFAEVGYDGPPELFSMYCCIFLGKKALMYDPEWVLENRQSLQQSREAFATKWLIPPHPVCMLNSHASL